ncbi:MAG: iron-sulfur cluster biosynthesis transcriptional regulator SufR [Prochlorotrichaceae cyanobacterium]|jgi:DeoR family suf operon transcriptional repressor
MSIPLHPSTKDDILRYLLQKGQATAQELADNLGISPQAIRRHLKDLEAETLILHQPVSSGMGRPQYVYHLSKSGRSYFPEAYDRFALGLLDTLAATVAPEQLQSILRQQWERKGLEYHHNIGHLPFPQRVKRLVELRRLDGYMTDCHPNDNQEAAEDSFIVTEYNCTIANVAESFPSICDYELALFHTALGEDCRVERTHWMIEGEHRCGYLIQSVPKQLSEMPT